MTKFFLLLPLTSLKSVRACLPSYLATGPSKFSTAINDRPSKCSPTIFCFRGMFTTDRAAKKYTLHSDCRVFKPSQLRVSVEFWPGRKVKILRRQKMGHSFYYYYYSLNWVYFDLYIFISSKFWTLCPSDRKPIPKKPREFGPNQRNAKDASCSTFSFFRLTQSHPQGCSNHLDLCLLLLVGMESPMLYTCPVRICSTWPHAHVLHESHL